MWFIAYRYPPRPTEAGLKFVRDEGEAIAEGRRLESLGYVITEIAPAVRTRLMAFWAGTRSAAE